MRIKALPVLFRRATFICFLHLVSFMMLVSGFEFFVFILISPCPLSLCPVLTLIVPWCLVSLINFCSLFLVGSLSSCQLSVFLSPFVCPVATCDEPRFRLSSAAWDLGLFVLDHLYRLHIIKPSFYFYLVSVSASTSHTTSSWQLNLIPKI